MQPLKKVSLSNRKCWAIKLSFQLSDQPCIWFYILLNIADPDLHKDPASTLLLFVQVVLVLLKSYFRVIRLIGLGFTTLK